MLGYPEEAIREAFLNALIHRSYLSTDAVQVKVMDSHLTIWSPGGIHLSLTVDQLSKSHPSKPNNRLIAEVCYKSGLIERWGRGTNKMIDLSLALGNERPEIIEYADGVCVTFRKEA